MRKTYLHLFISLIAPLLLCCSNRQANEPQATGQLTVNVRLSDMTSRAQASHANNLHDGSGMEDITVILVDSRNKITFIDTRSDLPDSEQQSTVVSIFKDDIRLGQYTIYAFGNTQRTSFSEVRQLLDGLKQGDNFTLHDAVFNTLEGTSTPTIDPSNTMLLTACQTVRINPQHNTATINLTRPIVWFEVRVQNNSDEEMTVLDLSFSNFNPSTGYLLPHDGNIPGSVDHRSLPAYDSGNPKKVTAKEKATIYEAFLFENRAESYLMNLTLQTPSGETAGITNEPIKTINTENAQLKPMTEQLRNQHIIVTVNAYYNKEDRQFNFEVTSWDKKYENIEFN